MPQRCNWQQYEQLSDFERGPQRSKLVEQAYRPPPRSERYGSCSVLASVDHRIAYHRGVLGLPKNTSTCDDRVIIRAATLSTTTSPESFRSHLSPSRHLVVSGETIRR
ncbi:hypothetical protein TNCV_513141 [Trichonephila clavipes]|nr:hypothetical protein TNCV_513141 [Trichonephila clavipes]